MLIPRWLQNVTRYTPSKLSTTSSYVKEMIEREIKYIEERLRDSHESQA